MAIITKTITVSSSELKKFVASFDDNDVVKSYNYYCTPFVKLVPSNLCVNIDNFWGEGNEKVTDDSPNLPQYLYTYFIRLGYITATTADGVEQPLGSFSAVRAAIPKLYAATDIGQLILTNTSGDYDKFLATNPLVERVDWNSSLAEDLPVAIFGDSLSDDVGAPSGTSYGVIYNLSVIKPIMSTSLSTPNICVTNQPSEPTVALIDGKPYSLTANFMIPNGNTGNFMATGTSTLGRHMMIAPYDRIVSTSNKDKFPLLFELTVGCNNVS